MTAPAIEAAAEALAARNFEMEQGEGEWAAAPEAVKPGWRIEARGQVEALAALGWTPPRAARPAPAGVRNLADSPDGIAAHFVSPASARTEYGQRVGTLHLRELPDGYWTRLRLVTERHGRGPAKEFLSTLIFDHHRVHDAGEQVRVVGGASFPVLSRPAAGRISPAALEAHHAEAAGFLVAYPEAIASLLSRSAGDTYRGPIR